MRHKTLFSLIALGGSSVAIAAIGTPQIDPPLQNDLTNQAVPDDTTAPDTLSNRTDVEPSAEPTDPTQDGTDTAPEPNASFY